MGDKESTIYELAGDSPSSVNSFAFFYLFSAIFLVHYFNLSSFFFLYIKQQEVNIGTVSNGPDRWPSVTRPALAYSTRYG